MIDILKIIGVLALLGLPVLLLVFLNGRLNLKRPNRSRQWLMPIFALIYGLVALLLMWDLTQWLREGLTSYTLWLDEYLADVTVPDFLDKLRLLLQKFLHFVNLEFLVCYLANLLIMIGYLLLKPLGLLLCKLFCGGNGKIKSFLAGLFYEQYPGDPQWYVKENLLQGRTLVKTMYYATAALSVGLLFLSWYLYADGLLTGSFFPVFALILMGEVCFFLSGLSRREAQGSIHGEADQANQITNYVMLRRVLRKLFGDKLGAEDTAIVDPAADSSTNDAILSQLEASDDGKLEAYGIYMRRQLESGRKLDRNYLLSGRDLLCGKSILFNNPFYHDLIPYVSYPMNRTLLRHKKVLIVLGRHGTEGDVAAWCEEGLKAVTNVPQMWNIGVLGSEPQNLDVGIITRSSVHDLKLHESNAEFFSQVEFVMLIEPSRLVSTAQIGLNSIVRSCRTGKNEPTFCSTDKNCDGLLDALSHILMCSITEVAATNRHSGICSYMCWETDEEYLQHRMLPNLSRYLGTGTELSFVALKNQVAETQWYGGESFPVVDMHWIVRQYYYDLLQYAQLPVSQQSLDDHFKVSANLWNAKVGKNRYITVEDEACNMFEVKRNFSTRAENQSFINIISPEYLLKDYMAENSSIFDADPKAIPYIVADYARTRRNVVMRLCLSLCAGQMTEDVLKHELMLLDLPTEDIKQTLWEQICTVNQPVGLVERDELGNMVLSRVTAGKKQTFGIDTICTKRKFSMKIGAMQTVYFISDTRFPKALLSDLQNAGYIAEDEKGESHYLGTELRGQIFQRYLPGQFFTFSGKYYEMLTVTSDGRVLVRRAADHITGRPTYRQVRNYVITAAQDSQAMGDQRQIGPLRLTKQYADFTVSTPAYYHMDRGNDFANSRKVTINGIPQRSYYNKQILRIDLPEDTDPKITQTLTQMLNEVFRTLFAENQPYLVAVTPGQAQEPNTYNLEVAGFVGGSSIYLIEDSQLDLGLLVAAERNLNRILGIICDYLQWHTETLEASLNPQAPAPIPGPVVPQPQQPAAPVKKGWFARVWEKIKKFFKKLWQLLTKPFRRKKPAEETVPAEPPVQEVPAQEVPVQEEPVAEVPVQEAEAPAEETAQEQTFSILADVVPSDANDTLEFEPEQVMKPVNKTMERLPYHQRHFLLYGGQSQPESLDIPGTLAFLLENGFANGALKQAREGKDIAKILEASFVPNRPGSHYCDFCGAELVGAEYQVLADGRERCNACQRTAVKTAQEFETIYRTIVRNMEGFYGIRFSAPIRVQMVNSQKLHKKLGRSFIPTGNFDGRILGVAIKDGSGYSILVENGAPRISSTMTIAHELTHIWQYLNWNKKKVLNHYGPAQELEIYEGMAKWVEIQYAYLIGEPAAAKREEICARVRDDEYGRGFRRYVEKYPLSTGTHLEYATPFEKPDAPL